MQYYIILYSKGVYCNRLQPRSERERDSKTVNTTSDETAKGRSLLPFAYNYNIIL